MVVRWSATRSSACRPSRSLSASRAEVALSSSSKGLFTTEELGDADRQARRHEQGQGGLARRLAVIMHRMLAERAPSTLHSLTGGAAIDGLSILAAFHQRAK